MSSIYHTIVIGSGVAGCCAAYFLKQRGVSVLLLDRSSVAASGGSGAAGAFVSPKIGKGSPLQELTNEAFEFAKDFYLQNFPKYFHQTSILRIPKDIDDAQKFPEYKKYNLSKYETIDSKTIRGFGIDEELDSFLFEEAGVCDAPGLTRAIWDQLPHEQFRVDELKHNGDCWVLSNTESSNRYRAENIILATGYQNDLLDMRYMGVRGTWGSRGDYYSSLPLSISMHKNISISANIDGIIKIGATHVKSQEPCLACKGEPLGKLFQTASKMVNTDDFRLKGTYCGMRAGSKDYFPLVGRVVDTQYMLEKYPAITRGSSPSLKYHKNLYICNGLGGRGFVFAPLMGKELAAHILSETTMDSRMDPDRLFLRWCRKDPSLRNNKK